MPNTRAIRKSSPSKWQLKIIYISCAIFMAWEVILTCNATGTKYAPSPASSLSVIQTGDTLASHVISNTTGITQGHCTATCSGTAACQSVVYNTATRVCTTYDSTAGNTSSILSIHSGPTTQTVYSKLPQVNKAGVTQLTGPDFKQSTDMANLVSNNQPMVQGNVCPYITELGLFNGDIPTDGFLPANGCPQTGNFWANPAWFGRVNAPTVMNGNSASEYSSWANCGNTGTNITTLWIDLGKPKWVTSVQTQGQPWTPQWVSTFQLKFSMDPYPIVWKTYTDQLGNPLTFTGNVDQSSVVTNTLWQPALARWIQFVPVTPTNTPCLRVAVYGCPATCYNPMGIHSLDIPPTSFSSSSSAAGGWNQAWQGVLNNQRGSWMAASPSYITGSFFEVDMGSNKYLTGIAIEGCRNSTNYLNSFEVYYQNDQDSVWHTATDYNNHPNFAGPINAWNTVVIYFSQAYIARYIKVVPLVPTGLPCIRMELIGCRPIDASSYLALLINSTTNVFSTAGGSSLRSSPVSTLSGSTYSAPSYSIQIFTDGDKATCGRLTEPSPGDNRISIDLGAITTVSQVEITTYHEVETMPDGLWLFDIFTRGTDLSGNGNHVYYSQSIGQNTDPYGRVNGGIRIPATADGYLYGTNYAGTLGTSGDHSFFTWFYRYDSNNVRLMMFSYYDAGGVGWNTNGFSIQSNAPAGTIYLFTPQAGNTVSSGRQMPLNKWVHVGYTYEASTSRLITYFNGQVDIEGQYTIDLSVNAPEEFWFGQAWATNCRGGWPAEFGLFCTQWYNRVLNQTEIQASMRCPWADFPRPVAMYPLDGIANANDYSGNKFNAVLEGTTPPAPTGSFWPWPAGESTHITPDGNVVISNTSLVNYLQNSFSVFGNFYCDDSACHFVGGTNSTSNPLYYYWYLDVDTAVGSTVGVALHIFNVVNGGSTSVSSNAQINIQQWYFIGFTFDDNTNIVSLYVQGQLQSSLVLPDNNHVMNIPAGGGAGILLRVSASTIYVACLNIFQQALTPRQISLISTCPLLIPSNYQAIATWSFEPSGQCGSVYQDAVLPGDSQTISVVGPSAGPKLPNEPFYSKSNLFTTNGYGLGDVSGYKNFVQSDFTIMFWMEFKYSSSTSESNNVDNIMSFYSSTTGSSGSKVFEYNFNPSGGCFGAFLGANGDGSYCNGYPLSSSSCNGSGINAIDNGMHHHMIRVSMESYIIDVTIDGTNIQGVNEPNPNCNWPDVDTLSIGNTMPWWTNTGTNIRMGGLKIFPGVIDLANAAKMASAQPFPMQVEPRQCNTDLTSLVNSGLVTVNSSSHSTYYTADQGMGYNNPTSNTLGGAWRPASTPTGDWIVINFNSPKRLTAISTLGDQVTTTDYVRSYYLDYSSRQTPWVAITDTVYGGGTLFQGNVDTTSIAHHLFIPDIQADSIRLTIQDHVGAASLRMIVYGCEFQTCTMDLTARADGFSYEPSTSTNTYNHFIGGAPVGSPNPQPTDVFAYFQVNLEQLSKVTSVATQGGTGIVTSYYFRYSTDNVNWDGHRGRDGFLKLLTGKAAQTQYVIGPYIAQYARFNIMGFTTAAEAYFWVYGCPAVGWETQTFPPVIASVTASAPSTAATLADPNCASVNTSTPDGKTIRIRCQEGAVGRYLTIVGPLSYDLRVCEITAYQDLATNLISGVVPLTQGGLSAASIANAQAGYLTNGNTSEPTAQATILDTAGQFITFDTGMIVRITRVVMVLAVDQWSAQFHGLDLLVANSTSLASAQFCDTLDGSLQDNGGVITLWCLLPTFGRYVFLSRSAATSTSNDIPLIEVQVY